MGTDENPIMGSEYRFPNIIGHSEAIKEIFIFMQQAIETDVDILITGETGTGKDLVAKEIHNHSPRRDKDLFAINCGAFSKEVLLSELFGYRKGAFKGAIEDKAGLFEITGDGTLILDSIDRMPLDTQLNLINVLKKRKVQRLGEYDLRDVSMRVIAISSQDLPGLAETGRFREDLYDYLREFRIHLPPLRERVDDIPLLAGYFYEQLCCQIPMASQGFGPGVMEMLQRYPWPGNVRELRNEIRQACMLVQHGDRLQKYHFSSRLNHEKLEED